MKMDNYLGIIEELEDSLSQLRSDTDNILIFSERAVFKAKSALLRMRDVVMSQGFENQYEEIEFYQYYRCNITFLDDRFFVRGKADIRLCLDSLHFLTDEHFSTSHDHSVASIKAFDMLSVYLKKEIKMIDTKEIIGTSADQETNIPDSKLFWTDTKKAAIELIYALHSSKSINSGKV